MNLQTPESFEKQKKLSKTGKYVWFVELNCFWFKNTIVADRFARFFQNGKIYQIIRKYTK
jgi:hypothetical protein